MIAVASPSLCSAEDVEGARSIAFACRRISVTMVQRRLGLEFDRACAVIDELELQGLIGPPRFPDPREVFIDETEVGA